MKKTLAILALITSMLSTSAFADYQPLTGGNLIINYSSDLEVWMQTDQPPFFPVAYGDIDFLNESYNSVTDFSLAALPRTGIATTWTSPLVFTFNLGDVINNTWRPSVQQTSDFEFDYAANVLSTQGSLGLNGVTRFSNGTAYAVMGDYSLTTFSPGQFSLNNNLAIPGPDFLRLVVDESQTVYSNNTLTLFGNITYGDFAFSPYFYQYFPGSELGTFQLTFQSVPEPSSVLLLAAGLGVVLYLRRRRQITV